jgi:hypothetical protein
LAVPELTRGAEISEFGISFDNFHTMRRCRLIWRAGDFVGGVQKLSSSERQ